MREQGNNGFSRKTKRRLFVGILVCLVVAVLVALLDLYEYRTATYVDLYTGIIREEAMIGVIPLPDRYLTPDHAEWAIQNMQDPAKRKWVICSDCTRNLLTRRGICSDNGPPPAVYAIYASTLDAEEKIRCLNEWHRDLDALSETADAWQEFSKLWWERTQQLPHKP